MEPLLYSSDISKVVKAFRFVWYDYSLCATISAPSLIILWVLVP